MEPVPYTFVSIKRRNNEVQGQGFIKKLFIKFELHNLPVKTKH